MNDRLKKLTTLHQDYCEKVLLNIMLIIILIIAVALFVGFSINPFSNEEVLRLQYQKLEELGYENVTFIL